MSNAPHCGNAKDPNRRVALCTQALGAAGLSTNTRYLLLNHRGIAYGNLQQFERARADFDAAIALKPKDAHAYAFRSWLQGGRNDADAAMADAAKAVALDDDLVFGFSSRAFAYYLQKNYDAAIADADRAIARDPKSSTGLNIRGLSKHAKRDFAAAIEDFGKAISLKPKDAVLYANRGISFAALKDWKNALADYNQSLALRDSQVGPLALRGVARRETGDLDGARTDLERASRLETKTPIDLNYQAEAKKLLERLAVPPVLVPVAATPTKRQPAAEEKSDPLAPTATGLSNGVKTKVLTAIAGTRIRVGFHYFLNPDCSSVGVHRVLANKPPEHGVLDIEEAEGFSNFPASNVRHACNSRKSPVREVWYTPDGAYVGTDAFAYDVIDPNGVVRKFSISVDVRQASQPRVERIPIKRRGQVVIVRASVNGVEGDFLIDTGASTISLSNEFAAKANVQYELSRTRETQTANGITHIHPGKAGSVRLGSLEVNDVDVSVKPKGSAGYGGGIDGLLGMSFLSHFTFHFGETEIRLSKRD
jgi:clan AA aspartic protease (TIGR02281 family)